MLIYIIILSILSKMFNSNIDKSDRIFLLFLFIPMFLISGLRASHVGTDTSNYMHGFNLISSVPFEYIFDVVRWEKGYVVLNKMASILSTNSQIIIIITSFCSLFFIFKGIYESSSIRLFSVFLYFTLFYYFISFNAIRQFIAISLVLYGYKFVVEKKFFKYIFIILISSLFHKISILFIPMYYLYGIKLNSKKLIMIGVGFGISLVMFNKLTRFGFFLFPEYAMYVGTQYFQGGGILTSTISGIILAFGLFIKGTNKVDKEFDYLLLIMMFSFITSIFSMNISLFNRFNYYFSVFNILFIPKGIYLVKDKRLSISYGSVISMITLIYFFARLFEGWQRVTPYNLFIHL